MNIIFVSLEQSFLLMPLVLGIYLSYSILKITDLTVDGTFVLGAAVFARLITESSSVTFSLTMAVILGAVCGAVVAAIQYRDKIGSLIAGVLMVLMLQSVNLHILGRPNISVYGHDTMVKVFAAYGDDANIIVSSVCALVALFLVFLLLKSRFGLILRGAGDNKVLLQKLGHSTELYKMAGLALSNAMAAGCGAISAQIYGYADVSMGYGVALTAIAAVLIGGQIMKCCAVSGRYIPALELIGAFFGTCVYFVIINIFLAMGLDPINLKLVLGLSLIFFLRVVGNRQYE